MNITVIIPSLNPDEKLEKVVDGLVNAGYKDIVVINDGSDDAHKAPFERIEKIPQCTVLTHEVNKGKGRALKTAFSYILENRKDISGVVTVDGDNQHQVQDITACVKMMEESKDAVVLGCRNFSGDDVPARSKFGNNVTSFVFKTACGLKISDTQTGLRAIPYKHLNAMIEIDGERFEYETNMLLSLKKYSIPFKECTITTVYIEENQTSHFNPIVDSFKIYKVILKFMFSSLASSVIDILLYTILIWGIGGALEEQTKILVAVVAARAVSSLFNCIFNKKAVFKSDESYSKVLVKYYVLCIIQTAISYFGVAALNTLLKLNGGLLTVFVKIVVDVILFFISYRIQKAWVYNKK